MLPPLTPAPAVAPWVEGLRRLAARGLLPTSLSSRQLQLSLAADLKRWALFSARVEEARVLQKLSEGIKRITGGPTAADAAARAAGDRALLLDPAQLKHELQQLLDATGYVAPAGLEGTIQDVRSERRVDLILRTQEELAHGYGRFLRDQDEASLDLWPAQELVRIADPVGKPRDWRARWRTAGAKSGRQVGDGWLDSPMAALKNHPIWERLGDPALFSDALGNPYPPFAFSSGMDVEPVDRSRAVRLGLLAEDDPAPEPKRRELTTGLRADAGTFDEALLHALEATGDLKIEGGVLTLAP